MKVDDSKRFVLDASVALAWCFEEEKTPYTERLLDLMAQGVEAVVPSLWPLEVANALLTAERRKRITAAQSTLFLEQLTNLNVTVELTPVVRAFGRIFDGGRQWNLTVYDAAYLELALRQGLPLATLDDRLRRTSKAVGVMIFP